VFIQAECSETSYKIQTPKNHQKKEYNLQNTAEVLIQELKYYSEESPKNHVNSSQPNSVSNKTASSALECCYEKDAN
jgi:hypothetical protein